MILIVDDDPSIRASLTLMLKQEGMRTREAAHPDEAVSLLEAESFDLVLQDMNFSRATSGEEGLALLRDIRERKPSCPVVLMTAWGSIPLAVEGMKAGASDFVTKPWDNGQLLRTIRTHLSLSGWKPRSLPGRQVLAERLALEGLWGEDPAFLEVLQIVARVAPTDAPILILGESGTGKELIADAIHRSSERAGAPFVKVNLGGIATGLFESEMFGHVRGAFTDAHRDREGRFTLADRGTIFLDEIGDLDPSAQVKLLRVLQEQRFEVLGDSRPHSVNVRVVSATNRNLSEMVTAGTFREDLYYRLNLITLRLPPLRDRPGDIPILAREFLSEASRRYGRPDVSLSTAARDWLQQQRWPGNVRQLQKTMERAVLVGEGDVIEPAHFRVLSDDATGDPSATRLPAPGAMTLEQLERSMIERCMAHFEGNVSRAAEALGLSRAALYRRIEKHGLHVR